MILTVDPGRQTLTLYSGRVKVARVHFQQSPNIQVSSGKRLITYILSTDISSNDVLSTDTTSEISCNNILPKNILSTDIRLLSFCLKFCLPTFVYQLYVYSHFVYQYYIYLHFVYQYYIYWHFAC
jgi:hypothetical protein